jgi:hypothetical protein
LEAAQGTSKLNVLRTTFYDSRQSRLNVHKTQTFITSHFPVTYKFTHPKPTFTAAKFELVEIMDPYLNLDLYKPWTPRCILRETEPKPAVERVKGRALEILKEVLLVALAPFPEAREALCLAFLEFDARAAHLIST